MYTFLFTFTPSYMKISRYRKKKRENCVPGRDFMAGGNGLNTVMCHIMTFAQGWTIYMTVVL